MILGNKRSYPPFGGLFRNQAFFTLFLVLAGGLLTACGVDLQNPPRLATATARASTPLATRTTQLDLPAPTATPSSSEDGASAASVADDSSPVISPENDGLTIWIDETSPEHRRVLNEIADEFADRNGINVAVQLVSPALLPELVNTAVLSGTLPDLILHPLEYTAGWVENGILDVTAADEVVDRIGRDRFDAAAIDLLTSDNQTAAIPSDGFHQLLLYRADWFDELGLRQPDTYTAIETAAERIFNPEEIISGLVLPTESNLVTTHQAFEQIALANGCHLVDEQGEVTILDPVCQVAIAHYYSTINRFSPSGVQTDTSAAISFLTGRTGMIMTSPAILPDLAGLNPAAVPACTNCEAGDDGVNDLAHNTGILTEISGPNGEPTAFGNLRSLGVTTVADRSMAQAFAEFWFEEGYDRWLAVDSERKVPMLLGTADDPQHYIAAWGTTPLQDSELSLSDIYGDEVVARLRDGIAAAPRWGIRESYGSLMTRIYDEYLISIVLQEMLSGYFDSETTLREAYRRTIDLIPNYSFPNILTEEKASP